MKFIVDAQLPYGITWILKELTVKLTLESGKGFFEAESGKNELVYLVYSKAQTPSAEFRLSKLPFFTNLQNKLSVKYLWLRYSEV